MPLEPYVLISVYVDTTGHKRRSAPAVYAKHEHFRIADCAAIKA
jgi:hypothetical protein